MVECGLVMESVRANSSEVGICWMFNADVHWVLGPDTLCMYSAMSKLGYCTIYLLKSTVHNITLVREEISILCDLRYVWSICNADRIELSCCSFVLSAILAYRKHGFKARKDILHACPQKLSNTKRLLQSIWEWFSCSQSIKKKRQVIWQLQLSFIKLKCFVFFTGLIRGGSSLQYIDKFSNKVKIYQTVIYVKEDSRTYFKFASDTNICQPEMILYWSY